MKTCDLGRTSPWILGKERPRLGTDQMGLRRLGDDPAEGERTRSLRRNRNRKATPHSLPEAARILRRAPGVPGTVETVGDLEEVDSRVGRTNEESPDRGLQGDLGNRMQRRVTPSSRTSSTRMIGSRDGEENRPASSTERPERVMESLARMARSTAM